MRFKSFYKYNQSQNLKRFLEYFELTSDMLREARPFESKYSVGWKFFLKDDQITTFNNKAKLDPNFRQKIDSTFFTKINPIGNAIEINLGGDLSKDVYLQHDNTKQVFHVVGASMGIHFNRVTNKEGINWNNTAVLETAQCLGVYVNGNVVLETLLNKQPMNSYITQIKNTFNKPFDWDITGKTQILKHIDSLSVADWSQLASLMAGTFNFMNNLVHKIMPSNSYYIIHGLINTYYNAEEMNPNIETAGTKANTADMIISTVPAEALIELIRTLPVNFDAKGVCSINNAQFIQVSLKKEKGGAQLGKITSMIQQKYNIPRYIDLIDVALEEGFKDIFSSVITKIKDIGKLTYNKIIALGKTIVEYTSSMVTSLNSGWSQQWNKDLREMEIILNLPTNTLKETLKIDKNGQLLLTEKELGVNEYLAQIANDVIRINKIIRSVNNRLDVFIKDAKATNVIITRVTEKLQSAIGPINVESIIKLFANYTAIYMLNSMGIAKAKDAQSMFTQIFEIQKEMLFGKTCLPLYKVYGAKDIGDNHTFEFLKTGKEYIDDRLKEVQNLKQYTMGCRVNINDTSTYYNLLSHLLYGIDENGEPQYSVLRIGTNQGGSTFSFVFEGTIVISYKQLLNAYK